MSGSSPSIRSVADSAGVSVATVSNVLNGKANVGAPALGLEAPLALGEQPCRAHYPAGLSASSPTNGNASRMAAGASQPAEPRAGASVGA